MAKSKAKETGLSVKGQFTQSDIPDLVAQIDQKIKALQGDNDESSVVSGPIDQFGELKDINDPMKLMEVYNYVTKKIEGVNSYSDVFKAAAPTIKVPTMKIANATLPVLQKAILGQYKKATNAEELAKLKEAKKELESCLSEDMKVQAKLANVASLLSVQD